MNLKIRQTLLGWILITAFILSLGLIYAWSERGTKTLERQVAFETTLQDRLTEKWETLLLTQKVGPATFDETPINGQSFLSDVLKSEVGDFRELRQVSIQDQSVVAEKWRAEFEASPFQMASLLERLALQDSLFIDQFQISARDKDSLSITASVILLSPTVAEKLNSPTWTLSGFRDRNPFDPERQPVLVPGVNVKPQRESLVLQLVGLKNTGSRWEASLSDGKDGFPVTVRAGDEIASYKVEAISDEGVSLKAENGTSVFLKFPFSE